MSAGGGATTEGRFRVLSTARAGDGLVLVDCADLEPVTVAIDGYEDDLGERVAALRPGNLVEATLSWADGAARFAACEVVEPTLFAFAAGVTGLFEDATRTWQEAEREGEAMNSRVTRDTDGRPNGALYVFAKQPGERDLFEEFRNGARPLEPLLDAVERPEPYEVFVFRPADEPFVLVYIVFERESLLANTVRDTYGCPRSPDPGSEPETESDSESESDTEPAPEE